MNAARQPKLRLAIGAKVWLAASPGQVDWPYLELAASGRACARGRQTGPDDCRRLAGLDVDRPGSRWTGFLPDAIRRSRLASRGGLSPHPPQSRPSLP